MAREEQRAGRGGGEPVLDVGVELGAHRVGGVAGAHQARVREQAAQQIVERLVALDRFGHRAASRRRERRELALVGLLERRAVPFGLFEVALHLR
jgi:hypothetical protein